MSLVLFSHFDGEKWLEANCVPAKNRAYNLISFIFISSQWTHYNSKDEQVICLFDFGIIIKEEVGDVIAHTAV